MTALDEETRAETVKGPAKRWRNWWRASFTGMLPDGRVVIAGDVVCSNHTWPSHEVARQKALDHGETLWGGRPYREYWEHVGAFPEGPRP